MNFNFGEVLSRAWQITWKYKVLWIFGLLASCAGGGSARGSSFQQPGNFSGADPLTPEMIRQLDEFFQRVSTWLLQHAWVIYASIVLAGLLLILQLFLATMGQTGLIRGAYHSDSAVEKLRFGELWRESLHYFWRVTGLGFLVWGPYFALFLILPVLFVLSAGQLSSARGALLGMGIGFFLFFVALCFCLLPLMIALNFFYRQTLLALLVEDIGVFASLARGWDIIVSHFGELFIMGLILFGIAFAFGVALAIPTFIVVIPLMNAFLAGNIRSWTPFLVSFALLLAYAPISWFLSGIFRTFSESAWTLTYMRLTQKPHILDSGMPQNPEDGDKTILSVPNA